MAILSVGDSSAIYFVGSLPSGVNTYRGKNLPTENVPLGINPFWTGVIVQGSQLEIMDVAFHGKNGGKTCCCSPELNPFLTTGIFPSLCCCCSNSHNNLLG